VNIALVAAVAVTGSVAGTLADAVAAAFARDATLLPRDLWPTRTGGRALGLAASVATACIFGALAARYATPLRLAVSLCETTALVAILLVDLRTRLIPTALVALVSLIALGGAGAWPDIGLSGALTGGLAGLVAFAALFVAARVAFGSGALGLGDVYLAFAIGCVTGYPLVAYALVYGLFLGFLGALGAFITLTVGGKEALRATLPYGPFLVTGAILTLVQGNMR
jgi:leader peptidase (prepilin peptidase)/N-methyltransferase